MRLSEVLFGYYLQPKLVAGFAVAAQLGNCSPIAKLKIQVLQIAIISYQTRCTLLLKQLLYLFFILVFITIHIVGNLGSESIKKFAKMLTSATI